MHSSFLLISSRRHTRSVTRLHRSKWRVNCGKLENLISKLNFYKLIPYPVDRWNCPAPCVRKKHPELGLWPGPVVSCSLARWLYSLPAGVLRMRGACALPLFDVNLRNFPLAKINRKGRVGIPLSTR